MGISILFVLSMVMHQGLFADDGHVGKGPKHTDRRWVEPEPAIPPIDEFKLSRVAGLDECQFTSGGSLFAQGSTTAHGLKAIYASPKGVVMDQPFGKERVYAISPDGTSAVMNGRVFNRVTGKSTPVVAKHHAAQFSPDGKSVVMFQGKGKDFRASIFQYPNLKLRKEVSVPDQLDFRLSPTFSASGRRLAINPLSKDIHLTTMDPKGKTLILKNTSTVEKLIFSPDEKYLITTNSKSKMQIFDTQTGKQVYERSLSSPGEFNFVEDLEFSNDGTLFMAASNAEGSEGRLLDLNWKTMDLQEAALDKPLSCLAISPDSGRLALGTRYGKLDVYNMETIKTFIKRRNAPFDGELEPLWKDLDKDSVTANRALNKLMQSNKGVKFLKEKLLSDDPEKLKREIVSLFTDKDLQNEFVQNIGETVDKELLAQAKTGELGALVRLLEDDDFHARQLATEILKRTINTPSRVGELEREAEAGRNEDIISFEGEHRLSRLPNSTQPKYQSKRFERALYILQNSSHETAATALGEVQANSFEANKAAVEQAINARKAKDAFLKLRDK